MPSNRSRTSDYTVGEFVSARYLLENSVPTEQQMRANHRQWSILRWLWELPDLDTYTIRYLDPEPIPSDEVPPKLNEYPKKHLGKVNGSTYYTHTKKWNQLNINEQAAAMDVARATMDVARATNDVQGHDTRATPTQRRARDEPEPDSMDIDDEPDSNPAHRVVKGVCKQLMLALKEQVLYAL